MEGPYPVTIVKARYGGTYEPGRWLAFPLVPDAVPKEHAGNDIACSEFFKYYERAVGGGDTPDAALRDLIGQLDAEQAG